VAQQAVRQLRHGKHEHEVEEQLDHAHLAAVLPAALAQQRFCQFHSYSFINSILAVLAMLPSADGSGAL